MRDESHRRLAKEIRETVPRGPGVYAFVGCRGQLLYIGKSVNLRQRMSSYLSQDPLAAEPHLGRMVASIKSFAWWQTRSELLALLLEDVMIKEHMPPLNTRQREFKENRYLELTDDEFPACLIVEHADDFGSREVFGPLKDRYSAAALRGILHEALGVRTCGDPEPVRRCLDHDIGRCAGPCRGALGPGEYRQLVALARGLLRGNGAEVLRRLLAARDRAAAKKRFEEAARLQSAMGMCRRYEAQQRFAGRFTGEACALRCDDDDLDYRFVKGALAAPRDVVVASGQSERGAGLDPDCIDAHTAGRRAVAVLRGPPAADRRFLADRARIVRNWARRRGDSCRIRFDSQCR